MTEKELSTTYKPQAIGVPIAKNGDKNQIPDNSSDTSVVDVNKGIPSIYSMPRAAGGKSMARRDMNGMFNLLSQPEYFQQYMGRTLWDSGVAATGYPEGAKVWYYDASGNSAEYVSKTDNNKGTPGSSTDWVKTGNSSGNVVDSSSIKEVITPELSKYVSLSGTQTITGSKTFSVSPSVPTISVDSLSASGTRSINEQTLLAAIGSVSSGGMFIDPSIAPYRLNGIEFKQITKPSVIIIYDNLYGASYGHVVALEVYYSSTKPEGSDDGQLLTIRSPMDEGGGYAPELKSQCSIKGCCGPFYIKSGYVWTNYTTSHSIESAFVYQLA